MTESLLLYMLLSLAIGLVTGVAACWRMVQRWRLRCRVAESRVETSYEERDADTERLNAALESVAQERADLEARCEAFVAETVQELESLRNKSLAAERWEHRFWDLHKVVDRLLKERDEWRSLHQSGLGAQLEGIAVLEHQLVKARQLGMNALKVANEAREKLGLSAIRTPDELQALTGSPVGELDRYERHVRVLCERAHAMLDAEAQRSPLVDYRSQARQLAEVASAAPE